MNKLYLRRCEGFRIFFLSKKIDNDITIVYNVSVFLCTEKNIFLILEIKGKSMMKKFKKVPVGAIVLLLSLIAIIGCWFYLKDRIEKDSSNPFVLQMNGGRDDSVHLKIELMPAKSWVNNEGADDETVGAQYDGKILNGYTSDIEDWKLVIKMPAEGVLDSSWNGTYEVDGESIILTPDENTNIIPAGEEKTFGFFIYHSGKCSHSLSNNFGIVIATSLKCSHTDGND